MGCRNQDNDTMDVCKLRTAWMPDDAVAVGSSSARAAQISKLQLGVIAI